MKTRGVHVHRGATAPKSWEMTQTEGGPVHVPKMHPVSKSGSLIESTLRESEKERMLEQLLLLMLLLLLLAECVEHEAVIGLTPNFAKTKIAGSVSYIYKYMIHTRIYCIQLPCPVLPVKVKVRGLFPGGVLGTRSRLRGAPAKIS